MTRQIENEPRFIDANNINLRLDTFADNDDLLVPVVSVKKAIAQTPTEDVVKIVRCKDCKFRICEQDPEHGKTTHTCSVLNTEVFREFYCYYGKAKGD